MDAAHTAQRRGTFFLHPEGALPTGMNSEEKRRARARLKALRRSLAPEDVRARGERVQARLLELPQYQRARTVALYAALDGEVPTDALLAAALRDKKTVVFPVVPTEGRLLRFRSVEQQAHLDRSGRLAILEPLAARPEVELDRIELFVVPGLGFSRQGDRLGRGAGYYDATLALAAPTAPRIGVAFAEQVLEALPVDQDDVPMHWVVTEEATFAAPEAPATVVGARVPSPT
jgi:5-formyltetrahydrofolate cyclo-ligase